MAIINGTDNNESLLGTSGVDTINGLGGDDWLEGLGGADVLDGGTGNDAANYSSSGSAVTVNLLTGVATGGDAQGDTFISIESVVGSAFDDNITGNSLNNTIYGGLGNDTVSGGEGDDWLETQQGADIIDGGNGVDTVAYRGSSVGVTVNLLTNVNTGGEAQGDSISNVENIFGSEFDDNLTGDNNVNTIYGLGGNDTINGGAGADWIDGGDGVDTLTYVTSSAGVNVSINGHYNVGGDAEGDTIINIENLTGSNFNDVFTGNSGDNVINGLDGGDWLEANGGADTINGGNGVDTAAYRYSATGVTVNLLTNINTGGDAQGDNISNIENIFGSEFDDNLTGDTNANTIYGLGGNDTINGGVGADWLEGNDGNDIINGGDNNDWIVGGIGADTIDGGAGSDGVSYSASASGVTVNLLTNINTGGEAAGDLLTSIETVTGSAFDDNITGNNFNNTIYGGLGNDTVSGGDGNDWLETQQGADTIDGGNGTDTITYRGSASAVTVNLLTNVNTGGDAQGDSIYNVENIYGSAFDDTITGSNSNNYIYGLAGNDTVNGADGDDWIYGQGGADTIDGGNGADGASYFHSTAGVTVNLLTNINTGGDAQGDSLTSIEYVYGSAFNDNITGNASDNILTGGAGVDVIDGSTGSDIANYFFSSAAVTVNLATGVHTGGEAQGDILINIENVSGSAHSDTITGDDGDNTIYGQGGADNINGGAGKDTAAYIDSVVAVTVNLETGINTGGDAQGDVLTSIENLSGTVYDDNLTGNSENNVIDGLAGNDTLTGGAGADKFVIGKNAGSSDTIIDFSTSTAGEVISLVGFTNSVDFANLVINQVAADTVITLENGQTLILKNVTASSLNPTHFGQSGGSGAINGTAGNDILNGTAAADIINGFAGNDTINGSAGADTIDGGADIDTVSYASSSFLVNVNLSSAGAQLYGDAQGDILINVENLVGSAFGDTLTAAAGGSNISGGNGNDTINGKAGNDVIHGDGNNDTVYGGNGDDTIYGDDGDDLIYGQGGNNLLIGGVGADTLNGFTGVSTASYATSATGVNVNLSITTAQSGGDAAGDKLYGINNVIGSAFNDTLTGNNSINVIDGGDGADTIDGGAGNDTVTGGAGADIFVINKSSGSSDVINDFDTSSVGEVINLVGFTNPVDFASLVINQVAADTVITLENGQSLILRNVIASSLTAASFGGAAPSVINGTSGNDVLNGTSAADIINGLAGNDTINGSAGADTIDGGADIDTMSYAASVAAVNVDISLATAQSGGDALGDILSNIENLVGSAFGDILTGNATANVLTGGAGADVINGGAGIDTISYATSAAGVAIDLSLSTAQSGGDATGDILSSIENIIGSGFNDIFVGTSAANNFDGGNGSDTVSYAASTGAVVINIGSAAAQVGGHATGDILTNIENVIGSNHSDYFYANSSANTIDGGAGSDTLYYIFSNAGINVNLGVATPQSGGHAAGDILTNIEHIVGSVYVDTIVGNGSNNNITSGNGNDIINGNGGDDRINGGVGADNLTGGLGADKFVYVAINDSGTSSGTRDTITDFSVAQADKIDLSAFAGTFNFNGTGAFTGTAQEVNYEQVSGNTIISIDADGNGALDFQIELTGLYNLAASDFVL